MVEEYWSQMTVVLALWVLDNKACKRTLRICHTYWFSTAKVVRRTRLCVTLHIGLYLTVLFFVLDITGRQSVDRQTCRYAVCGYADTQIHARYFESELTRC
jgi:hypothetical protein